MKKSWMLSLITSFVLLGGALLSPSASADAAKVATSTYSDSDQSYSEDDYLHEELMDELDLELDEAELTADQQEFIDYVNQILALKTYLAKASTALESIRSQADSPNRKSIYLKLTNTVIPNYTKLVSKLKQIKPTNPKLKKIHATFVKGNYNQLEGLLLYKQAVSKTKVNYTILKQANTRIETAIDLLEQSEQQLYAYAKSLSYDF
ncbi:hypothetical protein P9222_32860 [Paenibacillus amylolyticus]|nr:hypothetical protein [Paenibacillus amylolyticus]WFR62839.1 hypothetical protein P9222_32860 [Paenibacillus amylolyticus]